jgi:hypothetical protein
MAKITFEDKVALDEQPAIADVNKVRAIDINQIKSVVNGLDDTVSNLGTTLSSSYLPLTGGTLSGDLAFSHTSASADGHISWTQGTYQQRIKIVDNSGSTANTFVFQKSADSGSNWTSLLTIANDGKVTATTFVGALSGNATTATTASKADRLTTGRTLTIGNTGKEFAGNANVSWSLSEIGAAPASHSHNYIPTTGGTLSSGSIKKSGDSYSWSTIRDSNESAPISITSYTGYQPAIKQKTPSGVWGIGCYTNAVHLTYFADGTTHNDPTQLLQLTYNGNGISAGGVNIPHVWVQSGQPSAKQTGDIWFA